MLKTLKTDPTVLICQYEKFEYNNLFTRYI